MNRPLLLLALAAPLLIGACEPKGLRQPDAIAAHDLPALTGRVVDQANLLSPAEEQAIAATLQRLEGETTDQFVVVTVASLNGMRIEEYGLRLGRGWGIGRKGLDNGVLLIVAPTERQVRIEVGTGLEGVLTDPICAQIIREQLLPGFARGDFPGGIKAGVEAVVKTLEAGPRQRPLRQPPA